MCIANMRADGRAMSSITANQLQFRLDGILLSKSLQLEFRKINQQKPRLTEC